MANDFVAAQSSLQRYAEGSRAPGLVGRLGLQVVQDFYLFMALAGKGFQVRAGTITAPLVGDVLITDTAAEMCVDAASGLTIIPVSLDLAIRLGTGTLHEYAVKSVGAASSAGTAFVPLPLLMGGDAASATARVQAAGAVTVAAEAVTTTRRHWSHSNPVAVGAGHDAPPLKWEPRTPPIIRGVGCLYVQIAATTTGPSYYAALDFIEAPTVNLV